MRAAQGLAALFRGEASSVADDGAALLAALCIVTLTGKPIPDARPTREDP